MKERTSSAQPTSYVTSSAPSAPPPGASPLYPELPGASPLHPELPGEVAPGQSYRLREISQLRKRLEDERDKRGQLYKKYRRGVNALDGIDTAMLTASMGLGIGGVGLLTTIVAAPVVLGLEIAAVACRVLGVTGKFVSRRLAAKAKKHNEIRVLAESKLNTIHGHVSDALMDGDISDVEFRLIVDEVDKYNQMKAQIRATARQAHAAVALDEETKTSLIKKGRDEARASFIQKLAAT